MSHLIKLVHHSSSKLKLVEEGQLTRTLYTNFLYVYGWKILANKDCIYWVFICLLIELKGMAGGGEILFNHDEIT